MDMSPKDQRRGDKSWVDAELEDSFDEEFEMEIDDLRAYGDLQKITNLKHDSALERREYFRHLLGLRPNWSKCRIGLSRPAISSS